MKKRIGILNSGGDVPGLNAVIAAATKTALSLGYEPIGLIKGFEGLLDPVFYVKLRSSTIREITGKGGTILKSVNKGSFPSKIGANQSNPLEREIVEQFKKNYHEMGLEALIVIGGDGTLSTARDLALEGINVIGVPKTIDNDLHETDRTFGFGTAIGVIVNQIDKLRTTAASHDRIFFVETMGRHTGWLALHAGFAAEADMILLPEIEFSKEGMLARLKANKEAGKDYQIVIVAEGCKFEGNEQYTVTNTDRAHRLGGISELLAHITQEELGDDYDVRNLVLGHLQRGGPPNSGDRILAQRFGEAAVLAVQVGHFGKMVTLQGDNIELVEIEKAVSRLKHVPADHYMIKACDHLGISFGS